MNSIDLLDKLTQRQDDAADIALLRNAISINSVTGAETPFARFLDVELGKLGLPTAREEFLEDRENTWTLSTGNGPNLLFIGHTDTVHVRGWEEHWPQDSRSDAFAGIEVEDQIWGRGACDLKGGICAALAGLRLLQNAGYEVAGQVNFAFVGDEESGEPGSGISAGVKDLVGRIKNGEIAKPDFAVYVEPTKLDVYTAQIGFFIADISIRGRTAYFGTPELGVDALKATHEILNRIWAHDSELRTGQEHDMLGSSSILVTHIQGGGFIAVPGECTLSLIRKLLPGEFLDDAVARFESALAAADLDAGISISIDYPAGRDHPRGGSPVEIPVDTPPAQLLKLCVQQVRPQSGNISGAPYWSEAPFFVNDVGCPAVYCAPGDIAVAHTYEERIGKEEYLCAVRAFALFIAQYCGVK